MSPFRILKVHRDVSSKEILLAVTRALQERKFSAREIVQAQKELMDPTTRKAAEFIYFLDIQKWVKEQDRTKDLESHHSLPSHDLPLLTIFDTLDTINSIDSIKED